MKFPATVTDVVKLGIEFRKSTYTGENKLQDLAPNTIVIMNIDTFSNIIADYGIPFKDTEYLPEVLYGGLIGNLRVPKDSTDLNSTIALYHEQEDGGLRGTEILISIKPYVRVEDDKA